MKLFLLADHAAPHTRRWARWFALHGHEVHVLSFNSTGLSGYEPAQVHVLWQARFGNNPVERALKTPLILARMRLLAHRLKPDLLHAHSAGGYAWATMLSGLRPYVVTPWGTDLLVDARASRVNEWSTRQALRRAALVTTDGFHFIDILRDLGVPPGEVLVHTFGVDVEHYSSGPDEGEGAALGVGDAPVVISTRTPNPVHDVESFIRALPLIKAQHPEARYVVVGDGTERPRLQELARDLGVDAETRFTGMVEEAQMRRLLRLADVYVSTSFMDAGLASSTAEAMAVSLPVVQTDNSDNAVWTPDGEGGFLVPNSDPAAIADRVARLLGDPALRRAMGERNRATIVERYNRDTEMRRIEQGYLSVLAKRR